jgi:hypothetical protein
MGVTSMTKSASSEKRTIRLLRWVGYTFLVLALFDVIEAFIPPIFMNPAWEFQMQGTLVEHVVLPLLGLILVFYGEADFRSDWEILLLKIISWSLLVVGFLYLLLIPLGVSATFRLYSVSNNQINAQASQKLTQIQQFKEQLNKASDKDIEKLLSRVNKGGSPEIKSPEDLKKIKNQLSESSTKAESRLKAEAQAAQDIKNTSLLKNSVKGNLGALVSGISFLYLWRLTRWVRKFSES